MVFLRCTPIVPNWFINLASPFIEYPLAPFMLGTFIGVAPPSCIHIQAGTTLNTLTSTSGVFSLKSIALLAAFALVAIMPVIFKNYIRKKMQ